MFWMVRLFERPALSVVKPVMRNNMDVSADIPIVFGVAIWGTEYCNDFMRCCLASLLAEGNIPALPNTHNKNRFIFCTTPEDWERIQIHPNFALLNRYIQAELIPLDIISKTDYEQQEKSLAYKFHMVTKAHKAIVSEMYDRKSLGCLLFPDTIFSKGALKAALTFIENKKAVLCHFPRFATDTVIEKLETQGYIQPGVPITIENRKLVALGIENMNIEVLGQRWDIPYTFDIASEIWVKTPNNSMVCHSLAWCPVFIDYSKLSYHNIECLENNTIDGSYLRHNFKIEDLHLISDSDDFFILSYSPHAKLRPQKMPNDLKKSAHDRYKIGYWQSHIKLSWGGFIDSLKLELLKQVVYVHAENLTQDVEELEKKSRDIIKEILQEDIGLYEKKFWKFRYLFDKLRRVNNKQINSVDIEKIADLIAENSYE